MYQSSLLGLEAMNNKSICVDWMSAIFTKLSGEGEYDVVLEVSSQKFLVNFSEVWDKIDSFQIIAYKWFLELSNKIIQTIKNLLEFFWYRLD